MAKKPKNQQPKQKDTSVEETQEQVTETGAVLETGSQEAPQETPDKETQSASVEDSAGEDGEQETASVAVPEETTVEEEVVFESTVPEFTGMTNASSLVSEYQQYLAEPASIPEKRHFHLQLEFYTFAITLISDVKYRDNFMAFCKHIHTEKDLYNRVDIFRNRYSLPLPHKHRDLYEHVLNMICIIAAVGLDKVTEQLDPSGLASKLPPQQADILLAYLHAE